MEHLKIKLIIICTLVFTMFVLTGCYNDNYKTLYPSADNCDTANVTFTKSVFPIISTNCTSCHNYTFPSGNISLENYNDVVTAIKSGRLMGSIKQLQGYSPMPKGGGKLSDCDIKHFEIWINSGMPDN